MRLGLLEVSAVGHKAWEWCRIARAMDSTVLFFTREEYVARIREELEHDDDHVNYCTIRPNETVGAFLHRVSSECSASCDFLLANTLASGWFAWFRPACPFVGVVDDMNWWFWDTKHFGRYLRNMTSLRNLVLPVPFRNALTSMPLRRRIIRNLSGVIVEYPNFVNLLRESWRVEKPVFFFPRGSYAGGIPVLPSDRLRVVIPGAVERLRRDYMTVVAALEGMPDVAMRRCAVSLLGPIRGRYGRDVAARIGALAARGLELFSCGDGVPRAEFEQRMREADLILAPMQAEFIDGMRRETYSVTKGSGCFDDSVRFGKPTIVPAFYEAPPKLAEAYRKYRDAKDLRSILVDLAMDRAKTQAFREVSDRLLRCFAPGTLAKRFLDMVRVLANPE